MNPTLAQLQPYPFQRLRDLFADVVPDPALSPVDLSIGEPKHATPALIQQALAQSLDGLAYYPTTLGIPALREAISQWLAKRYQIAAPNPETQIIPVNGSREALFSFAQAVIDRQAEQPVVISPNPFYQIYEGAALLAGASPWFVNCLAQNGFNMPLHDVPQHILKRTQLVYLCSPGNPTGHVMSLQDWRNVFALSDQYGFIIAADECYSEIYFDEANPPLGALQAAQLLGRDFTRLVVFGSLSKRSNVPGLRSGFAAGDAAILKQFLLYRTYHGCAMNPAVQAASIAAWQDETHVQENRRLYAEKFGQVLPLLQGKLEVSMPDAAFYLWAKTSESDTDFARKVYQQCHVTVLPGSFLARNAEGINPGEHYIRMALVAPLAQCVEAAQRMCNLL